MCVELLTRATFYVVLYLSYLCVLSLGCSCEVVSTSASDQLERLVTSKMTYNVLMGTLNPTHLLTCSLTYVPLSPSSIIWYQPMGGDALRLGR